MRGARARARPLPCPAGARAVLLTGEGKGFCSGANLAAAGLTFAVSSAAAAAITAAPRLCPDHRFGAVLLQAVCWLLVAGGVAGTFLAGVGRRWAWLILFGLQPVWIAYALATGQPGFVLGSLAHAGAQLNGWLRGGDG